MRLELGLLLAPSLLGPQGPLRGVCRALRVTRLPGPGLGLPGAVLQPAACRSFGLGEGLTDANEPARLPYATYSMWDARRGLCAFRSFRAPGVAVVTVSTEPSDTVGNAEAFEPLGNQTLRDRVYAMLREAIANRRLDPGSDINLLSLAESFQVSRSPVREAMQQLHDDGLVTRRTNGRYVVTELSDKDLCNLYAVRVALEGLAAEEACRRMSDEERAHLVRLMQEERQMAISRDLAGLLAAGTRIHRHLAACSENRELEDMIQLLLDRVRPFTLVSTSLPERTTVVIEEHARLLDVLLRHDTDSARKLMEEHIAASRDRLLRR